MRTLITRVSTQPIKIKFNQNPIAYGKQTLRCVYNQISLSLPVSYLHFFSIALSVSSIPDLILFHSFIIIAVTFLVPHYYFTFCLQGPVHYQYDYAVSDPHTGDKKLVYEQRKGDVVTGGYTVKEADGTTRIVEYTATPKGGFKAVVKRVGTAIHPQVYENEHGDHAGGAGHGHAYSRVGITHYA